jgi:hypothetical protein
MIDCGCDEILLPQGSDGVDGKNAFTVTTVAFTQPAAAASVTITVDNTLQNTNQWAIPEQIIRITDASGNGGWYRVTSIVGTNQIIAVNLDYQPGSSTAGLTIAIGAKVSPAGLQGPAGTTGSTGADGVAGPPIVLNVAPTQTLIPGSDATATLTGGGGNYTVAFGIPSGLTGQDGSGTLHYSFTSTTIYTTTTTPGQTIFSATFATDTMCPNNGDVAKITGSFFSVGNFTSDPSRRIGNLNFYIGDSLGTPADIIPKASVIPAIDQSYRPRDLYITNAGNYGHFGFDIRINRISSTQSIITVSWEWNGETASYKKMYLSNSLTTGSLTFNTGAQALFQVKIDPVYDGALFGNSISIDNRNLIVEKITA